jgi:hypothetical protein
MSAAQLLNPKAESRVRVLLRKSSLLLVLISYPCSGGVKLSGSTSVLERDYKMYSSLTWVPWGPLRCKLERALPLALAMIEANDMIRYV